MDYTEEQLKSKFEALPEDVKEAITSADVDLKITELAKKYKLHIDKVEELSDETGLVMLGLTKPGDYLKNLRQRLELPEDMARLLVADVNEQIFKPIRESLKRIHGMTNDNGETNNRQQITNNGGGSYREPITDADMKIAGENGEGGLKRHELIAALENPDGIQKGGVGISAGFSVPKITQPEAPIVSPSQKLESTVRVPPTETTYVASAEPSKKIAGDPYREAV